MLRTILARSTWTVARSSRFTATPRPIQHLVRFNSTSPYKSETPEEKARREQKNDMQRDWDAPKLTYEQVKSKTLSPSPNAYLIDVREPDEVIQGSIPSSVNLPLSVLAGDLHLTSDAFLEKYGYQKPKKDQEIVFYCRSGKRSASASDVAKRNGYTNIYNYEGSWLEWVAKEGAKP